MEKIRHTKPIGPMAWTPSIFRVLGPDASSAQGQVARNLVPGSDDSLMCEKRNWTWKEYGCFSKYVFEDHHVIDVLGGHSDFKQILCSETIKMAMAKAIDNPRWWSANRSKSYPCVQPWLARVSTSPICIDSFLKSQKPWFEREHPSGIVYSSFLLVK